MDANRSESLDDPTEVFDLVDEHDRVIGTVRRGQAHGDPRCIHRSVQVLVFDSRGRLFLQRRSRHKDLFAGYLCASASGHVAQGEAYDVTAQRETREELGVSLTLRAVATCLVRSEPETEITRIFVARNDGPFACHPTETDGGLFLTATELADGIVAGTVQLTPAATVAIARAIVSGAWPLAQSTASGLVAVLTT